MGAGSSRSLIGKITSAILKRGQTREIPRDTKPAIKPGTNVSGYSVGHKGGGRKKK